MIGPDVFPVFPHKALSVHLLCYHQPIFAVDDGQAPCKRSLLCPLKRSIRSLFALLGIHLEIGFSAMPYNRVMTSGLIASLAMASCFD
jgi:hypothetical protein